MTPAEAVANGFPLLNRKGARMTRPASAAEAVANGAQALDDRYPGWWRHINLSTLNVASCNQCVCGQLDTHYNGEKEYPHWSRFAAELTGSYDYEDYGFRSMPAAWSSSGHGWKCHALTSEWALSIEARRDSDKLPAAVVKEKEVILA